MGLACSIEAKRRGLDALIIEKGALCNSFIGYPTQMEFFSTPELLEIGGHPFPTRDYKPRREEALDYYRGVATAEDLDLRLYEPVTDLRGSDGHFTVVTDEATHETRKVVVATGFYDVPNRMDVPGEDLDKVRPYFKEPYPYALTDVAVVGVGVRLLEVVPHLVEVFPRHVHPIGHVVEAGGHHHLARLVGGLIGHDREVAVASPQVPHRFVEAQVEIFRRSHTTVVVERLLAARLVVARGKRVAADLQQLRGREELHLRRVPDKGVAERPLLNDERIEPTALGLNATGKAHRPGSDDDNILHEHQIVGRGYAWLI